MKQALLLTFLSCSILHTHARFNQEQIPIDAIRQVQGGAPGVADTIAGAAISDLLAATNACDKLKRGDQILSELGEGDDAVAAAIGMVAAEKNFNPFAQDIPTICSDPTLPENPLLRGITPLIDPAVGGSDVANALSEQTKTTPLNADGKSVADLLTENGFTNFTAQDSAGNAAGNAAAGAAQQANGAADNGANGSDANANAASCAGVVVANNTVVDNANNTATDNGGNAANNTDINDNNGNAANNTDTGDNNGNAADNADAGNNGGAANAGAGTGDEDFGSCDPTMSFEGGRNGRPATEFTFQSNDPAIEANQQEALNPNIITNRICDELTNICNANDAAKTTCLDAKAQILALGTRDQSTADAWNALVSVGSAAGAKRVRRTRRSVVRRAY